ncbi:MAG: M14 family metallopeptidase [Alphaproteobacteria bacterium]|nr:M14 family metallopeptidase [Alphaproteobacteria bacterium]
MSLDPSSPFSADYFEARAKFLAAARDRNVKVASHLNPHAKGPKGEDLFIDIGTWGPDDAKVGLLTISGTHGVEGYAGSACQIGWLKSEDAANWPRHLKVVLVHALNPYGFAWNRRVNEENVDLNRNFLDHSAPYPANDGYNELKSAVAPIDLSTESLKRASELFRVYAKQHGAFALQEAVSKGQYTHPDGMYFGGTREQWSAGILRHVVRRELGRCGHVGVVDFHTGLGPYGYGELISEDAADTPAYRRARAWWGDTVRSTKAGESVSADVSGSVDSCIPRLLPHAEVTMTALEYGTYSTLEIFDALRADNWLHTRSDPLGSQAQQIKADIRCAFYPDRDDWKEMVWQRGEAVLAQAVAGLRKS